MATELQLEANRANCVRSTGPKTASGKARSSMNACKHGLTAQTIIIGDEDPAQFECLRTALEEEFEPHSLMKRELAERLAGIVWRMRRIPKFEAAIIEFHCDRVRSYSHSADARRRLEGPCGPAGEALIDDGRYSDAANYLGTKQR
jgi:hypothetical protein